jgi:RES domain-containing protein
MLTRSIRSRLTRHLVSLAHDRFHGCESCWRSNAFGFADETLADLSLGIRESRRLFRSLRCPRCDERIEPYTYVVTATEEELEECEQDRRFEKLYGRKLERFRAFLVCYPTLGAKRRTGRQLIRAVSQAKTLVLGPRSWYHASLKPGVPGLRAGRFHQVGQQYSYFAADRETAAVEALREIKSDLVEIAEIEIREPRTVIDLRRPVAGEDRLGSWFLRCVVARGYLSEATSERDTSQKEYRMPQFISDAAHQRGIHGVLYNSTRPSPLSEVGGDCLVLFLPPTDATPLAYRFSGPHIDINFLDQLWRLDQVSCAASMVPGAGGAQ